MAKRIRVSDDFHDLVTAHRRDEETMEETLKRMICGPDPRILRERGIIGATDDETADEMRDAIDRK